MKIYCTMKNDPLTMVYLGTSVEKAEEAVGKFVKYQKDERRFPKQFLELYSALPTDIEREIIQFFMCDGWWYSIVMFELNEEI